MLNPLNSIWSSFIILNHTINIYNNDYNTALIKHNQKYFHLNSGKYHTIPFTGKSQRLTAMYYHNQPETLLEWTVDYDKTFLDISLVDGVGSSFNLIADNYNITGDFYYAVNSPCSITHKDEHCCSGRFNNPNICGNSHEIKQYCNYIKTTVKPPNVYCYAYDDSAGTLIIKHNYILITFWNTKYYSNKLI